MTRPSCFVVYVVAIIRLVYVATWKVDFKKNNYNSFQEDDATSLFSIVMEIILTTVERLTSNVRRVELKFAKSTLLQVHSLVYRLMYGLHVSHPSLNVPLSFFACIKFS